MAQSKWFRSTKTNTCGVGKALAGNLSQKGSLLNRTAKARSWTPKRQFFCRQGVDGHPKLLSTKQLRGLGKPQKPHL